MRYQVVSSEENQKQEQVIKTRLVAGENGELSWQFQTPGGRWIKRACITPERPLTICRIQLFEHKDIPNWAEV